MPRPLGVPRGRASGGLAYADNPVRPAFRGRHPFGSDPTDAANPSGWAFQEPALGFALALPAGPPLPAPAHSPPDTAFCGPGNACTPADGCVAVDGSCDWRGPVTWIADCATSCLVDTPLAAACTESPGRMTMSSTCATGHAPDTIVVDDTPPKLATPGCPKAISGRVTGLEMTSGTAADAAPVGQIDVHQVGIGRGGRALETHTRSATMAAFVDTARWAPGIRKRHLYLVAAFVPARTTEMPTALARYQIRADPRGEPQAVTVSQDRPTAGWGPLGDFELATGAEVALDNATGELGRTIRSTPSPSPRLAGCRRWRTGMRPTRSGHCARQAAGRYGLSASGQGTSQPASS